MYLDLAVRKYTLPRSAPLQSAELRHSRGTHSGTQTKPVKINIQTDRKADIKNMQTNRQMDNGIQTDRHIELKRDKQKDGNTDR